MSKSGYFRLLILGLAAAVVFGLGSLLALSWINHSLSSRHRGDFMVFLASSVEGAIRDTPAGELASAETAARIREAMPGRHFGPPPGHREHHGPPRPDVWLFDAAGTRLFFEGEGSPERVRFENLPKPAGVHEVAVSDGLFHFGTDTAVIRLEHEHALFLVTRDEHRPNLGPLFFAQAVITISTLVLALFVSLTILFYYLRRKSAEARAVLQRLEHGDLKARFTIRRFDEFGGLLLDFNRMAAAIEKLVDRVHATERARKNLLAELGHDLRTPLTSLTTSFETVKVHLAKMSEEQRTEVFAMMEAEVGYIRELLESLMIIAWLHEPGFKAETQALSLGELLTQEADQRRRGAGGRLEWSFEGGEAELRADPHLIQRLFRNALDNAGRFAKSRVRVRLTKEGEFAVVTVSDDGPGFTPEALETFGKRQEKRSLRSERALNFSLGLGSVIMKTIAELHAGSVSVRNSSDGGGEVTVRLPLAS